jgi:hypothetical protein
MKEAVAVTFVGAGRSPVKKLWLNWEYFTERTDAGESKTVAAPFAVPARASVSHETQFYARYVVNEAGNVSRENFLKFNDFKKMIDANGGIERIRLDFSVTEFRGSAGINTRSASCEVIVDDLMRSHAADPDVGTFPRDCNAN